MHLFLHCLSFSSTMIPVFASLPVNFILGITLFLLYIVSLFLMSKTVSNSNSKALKDAEKSMLRPHRFETKHTWLSFTFCHFPDAKEGVWTPSSSSQSSVWGFGSSWLCFCPDFLKKNKINELPLHFCRCGECRKRK